MPPGHIPLAIYADSVDLGKADQSFYMITASDLQSDKGGERIPICVIHGAYFFASETKAAVWDFVALDLTRCVEERRAKVVQIKGDMQEFVSTHGLPSWSRNERCCFFCDANKQNRFSPEMPCRQVTDEEYLQEVAQLGFPKCPLSKASPMQHYPGFTLKMFVCDWMHTADLGVTQEFVAVAVDSLISEGYVEIKSSKLNRSECE